jgi:hypothetical protein
VCPNECDLQTPTVRRLMSTRAVEPWYKNLGKDSYKAIAMRFIMNLSSGK